MQTATVIYFAARGIKRRSFAEEDYMTELTSQEIIKAIGRTFPYLKLNPTDLKSTLDRLLAQPPRVLDRERFNIVLAAWGMAPVTKSFFAHYFEGRIESGSGLVHGLGLFIKDALWKYGDLRRAVEILGKSIDVRVDLAKDEYDVSAFKERLSWNVVEDIPPEDRGCLGYVSGTRPYNEQKALALADQVLRELQAIHPELSRLSPEEVKTRLLDRLTEQERERLAELNKIGTLGTLDLWTLTELTNNQKRLEDVRVTVQKTIDKVEALKIIGKRNQTHYLQNIEMIDVYVATSMRDDRDYLDMHDFIKVVFADDSLTQLNLRVFDPTLCYCPSRIDKGIIECLLVRTAKATIYCAQKVETFGKDSELAATLCQGKPVIVYVPTGSPSQIVKFVEGEEIVEMPADKYYNKRAQTFRDYHPLGLQVGIRDGVARGVIVVRSAIECAMVLHRILTNTLSVKIHYEEDGIVLKEELTQSVVRVMTGWGTLSHAFWSNFEKSLETKTGRPD
jgi:hypothetical protein